jgi:hypothetical protein
MREVNDTCVFVCFYVVISVLICCIMIIKLLLPGIQIPPHKSDLHRFDLQLLAS